MNMTRRGFLGALLAGTATAVAAKVLPASKPVFTGEVGVIRDWVIVTDKPFNADPTGVRDSTQAFQDAIRSKARVIRVPAGTYRVSGVVIDRNVEIKGAGRDQTKIVMVAGDKPALHIKGDPSNNVPVKVSGLAFVAAADPPHDGVVVQHKSEIRECEVTGFRYGFRFEPTT